jgi:hypothetical protein
MAWPYWLDSETCIALPFRRVKMSVELLHEPRRDRDLADGCIRSFRVRMATTDCSI